MPLEFESISHGKIAFGFFNIETDMILLNQYFLFAEDLCHDITQATEKHNEFCKESWEVYRIEEKDIGNLMGAIYGVDFQGFIGEVYKHFPFPKEREKFKQNPEGFKNRGVIEKMVQKYAKRMNISFSINRKDDEVAIGEYVFERTVLQDLIKYVWAGAFPRWKEEIRPSYVLEMKKKIDESVNLLFTGLILD
jgi:hypothetical protein